MKEKLLFPIRKSGELLWLMGVIFVAFGVAICSKTNLGVSMIAAPPFVLYAAFGQYWSAFSVGMMEYLVQGLILLVLCLVLRRFNWRFLLAFASAVIYGYTVDLFLWILSGVSFDAIPLRFLMLLVGDAITAFGVACFFRTYMPLQVYELFVAEISRHFGYEIHRVKLCFDLSLLAISILLALTLFGDVLTFDWSKILYTDYHNLGVGTVLTTLINSPLIAIGGKLLDKVFLAEPAFPSWQKAIAIREKE